MLLAVVALMSAGCNWGPGSGYIDCGQGLPFKAVPPSELLPATPPASVPSGWKPGKLDRLSYLTPPPPLDPIYQDQDPRISAHRRCISWNGALFGTAVGREADELLLVAITPKWKLQDAVGAAGDQFVSVTVPGADAAVARLSRQQYYDGGGEKIDGQLTTVVVVVVQAGASVYTIDGSFAPGPPGERVAAAMLASLSIT
jgi:hypothetical protein